MGKIISFIGSPGSGVTGISLKVAQEIYHKKHGSVLFLCPDLCVPVMSYLFPSANDKDIYSLGDILKNSKLTKKDIFKNTVFSKKEENLGYLGYKASENLYSYPKTTIAKAESLIDKASSYFDYLIIDCKNAENDFLSLYSINKCDILVKVINPTPKSLGFYLSNKDRFSEIEEKSVKVMNLEDDDICLPISDVKDNFFGEIDFTLPYSVELKKQFVNGELGYSLKDRKFMSVIDAIVKAVS